MIENIGSLMGRDVVGLILEACVSLEIWDLVETLIVIGLETWIGWLELGIVERFMLLLFGLCLLLFFFCILPFWFPLAKWSFSHPIIKCLIILIIFILLENQIFCTTIHLINIGINVGMANKFRIFMLNWLIYI